MSAHPRYVTTSQGMAGWFAVLVWWNPEHGGFYEPWDTGIGRYATEAEAADEGRVWADDEGLDFRDRDWRQAGVVASALIAEAGK